MKRDTEKARAWQDRSRAKAMERKRTAKPSKSRQLPARSDKRKREMVDRRALVVQLLTEYSQCQIRKYCQGARAVDVHERLKRSRGGNILDPVQAHMVTACRRCHEWTEAEPAAATHARMLLPSWHKCPPVGPC